MARIKYIKKYVFRKHPPKPIPPVMDKAVINDPLFNLGIGTVQRIRRFVLRSEVQPVLQIPMYWDKNEEIFKITLYPVNQLGNTQGDIINPATEDTLSAIKANIDVPLSNIDSKISQPTDINSADVSIDNSAGTTDLTQPLFSSATESRQATIYRDPNDTGTIYIGGASSQTFPFNPGDVYRTKLSDLSKIYVKVPAGVTCLLHVIWET